MRANIQNEAVRTPTVMDPLTSTQPTVEAWDPPFERWMRMADDMLRDWPRPVTPRPVTPRPITPRPITKTCESRH